MLAPFAAVEDRGAPRSHREGVLGHWPALYPPRQPRLKGAVVPLRAALHHGGRLVSFDRRLSCEGVAGGREALWLIEA